MSLCLLTVDNSSSHLLNGDLRHGAGEAGWLSSWHGMVSVAGIAFAVVLVLMTLTFLCYHRVQAAAAGGSRASSRHHPRKTQVGQVLLRPSRGNGTHQDPRSRRADGASASLWSERTADTSPADSPTRSGRYV